MFTEIIMIFVRVSATGNLRVLNIVLEAVTRTVLELNMCLSDTEDCVDSTMSSLPKLLPTTSRNHRDK